MNGELTSFKEKAEEEAAKKKEEESRKAMTDAMSAMMLSMIEENNEDLRLERRRELSEVDSNHKCFLMWLIISTRDIFISTGGMERQRAKYTYVTSTK